MREYPQGVATVARGGTRPRPEPIPARSGRRWLAIGLLAVNLAACSAAQPGTGVPGGTSPSSSSDAGGPSVVTTGFQFVPAELTVHVGDQVEYGNQDKAAHTVTNGGDGKPDANAAFDEKLPRDSTITITFANAGMFGVTCTIHPTMNQVVTVMP